MMVEKFGFAVHELTILFLVNYIANIIFAPMMGALIMRIGEKWSLTFEYAGLTLVFLAYGGVYWFGWGAALAAALYVIDHLFFALAFAQKTYFQKIADPADIAPTAAVAFTINHIAAVFLPAALGYLWVVSQSSVFCSGRPACGGVTHSCADYSPPSRTRPRDHFSAFLEHNLPMWRQPFGNQIVV